MQPDEIGKWLRHIDGKLDDIKSDNSKQHIRLSNKMSEKVSAPACGVMRSGTDERIEKLEAKTERLTVRVASIAAVVTLIAAAAQAYMGA